MKNKIQTGNGRRVFGTGRFSRMVRYGYCSGYAGSRETLEDSPGVGIPSKPYMTGLDRFYSKWPNWEGLKGKLGLGTGASERKIDYLD